MVTSVGGINSGSVELVHILLYRSTTFKHLNLSKESVYHLAVKTCNLDMLAAILGSQASHHDKDVLKAKSSEGVTALHLAGKLDN
jgi:hypothetical protein